MFLKSMTLKGFKSFAESTTLQLEPGVTVVVGPNGSGKSNVVDAIAWVLGAQAPSAVRSQKMDDVIFAGTAKRPALGRAEVSLTIDNTAGLLPIEFTEVTVSRTLFRSGESEYAINGVNCRLLDVQELLSDAGVGRQQHVIVSQGQIDAVLNARAEDRRAIIEEAAGVLKFRRRREKAARRLDATEASLLRVQDLLREVRRQLRPLERQAQAAQRHGALVAELSALRIFLAGREIAALRARLVGIGSERAEQATRDQRLRAELARLDTEILAAEAELTSRGHFDLGDELARVEQLRERCRGLDAVLAERRRSLHRDRGQLMDSGLVANLEAEAARLADDLAIVERELTELAPQAEEISADEEALANQRGELAEIVPVVENVSAASAAAEVRGELRTARTSLERATADAARMRAQHTVLTERRASLEAEIEDLVEQIQRSTAAEGALVERLDHAHRDQREVAATLAALATEREAASADVAHWRARAEALAMALESARARAGAEHLADVPGVLGTVLDLVEIDSGWEQAVEAALGEALQAVIVDSSATARAALASLDGAGLAGAVLALGAHAPAPGAPAVGVGAPVRPHVRGRTGEVDGLLDALLRNATRVPGWEQAIDAIVDDPAALIVTERGDRMSASGWRVGSGGSGATAAALDEATERARRAEDTAAAVAQRATHVEAQHHAAQRSVVAATEALDDHDARFSAMTARLEKANADKRETMSTVDDLARSLADADDRVGREAALVADLESRLPRLEASEAAEAETARRQHAARAEFESKLAGLQARRRQLEVRNAGLLERQQSLQRRSAETERRLAADAEARAHAATRRAEVERALAVVDRLGELVERHRGAVDGRHAVLLEARRQQTDEARAVTARLDVARRARQEAERSLEAAREHARRSDVEEAEARLRLESAVETVRRDHDLEPAAAEAAPMPEIPEGTTAAARARELERELRLMGPINPLALEEFNELQERHKFLEEQLEDVRATRRELNRVISAVDHEIQSVFAAAFADVSGHFSALFETLFPGGTGKLTLTNPDDLLNTGIEIEAKPSGKNVKKLSLLSGGERSLTALAYLFAVFRSRPSPFYVMDEVEAALDDVNLHRFLGLIAEFRAEAQLLIVSHQKRTMEAGDSLLGVSMQPGGSSRVIVERVSAG